MIFPNPVIKGCLREFDILSGFIGKFLSSMNTQRELGGSSFMFARFMQNLLTSMMVDCTPLSNT